MFGDLQVTEPENDEGLQSLLEMVPADKRDMAEPMLRGYLGNVRAQLGDENYLIYCADLKRAYEAHVAGDHETSAAITSKYGIPYEMLAGAIG